jgi:hypothetical protein
MSSRSITTKIRVGARRFDAYIKGGLGRGTEATGTEAAQLDAAVLDVEIHCHVSSDSTATGDVLIDLDRVNRCL